MTLLPEVEATLSAAIHRDQQRRASRPRRPVRTSLRLRPLFLTGPVVGLAAAGVLALALGSPATTRAFAVTGNADGSVTVTLHQISGMSGLNAEFAKRGIRARAVPVVHGCTTTPGIAPGENYLFGRAPAKNGSLADSSETFYPDRIPENQTLVLAVKLLSSNRVETVEGLIRGQAPTCASDTFVITMTNSLSPR